MMIAFARAGQTYVLRDVRRRGGLDKLRRAVREFSTNIVDEIFSPAPPALETSPLMSGWISSIVLA